MAVLRHKDFMVCMGYQGGDISPQTSPGGGGGAMGPGQAGYNTGNGAGGPGYYADDFQSGLYVGAGGNGNGSNNNTSASGRTQTNNSGAANTGAGGGGSPGGGPRYSGGSGVLFVRYVNN